MVESPNISGGSIDALLQEDRTFPPPEEFRNQANIADPGVYEEALRDPEGFWARFAEELDWFKKWDQVLDWNPPHAKWFLGGQLNVSYNCIDRHLKGPRRNKAAIIWEGEPGDWKVYTYRDLYREVCKFANGLKSLGVKKGDRVTIYLPMVPELPIAMLACARVGAPHSVVFGGFSAGSLSDRINDSQSKVLITADGGFRRGNIIPLKATSDEALQDSPSVESVVVVRRTESADERMVDGRDVWWHDLVADQPMTCEPEPMDSEDMLYLLYTSGTTGKPKGIVHTTAGYLLGTYATAKWIFDLKEEDVYWCTADIGWVTGHSYIVYGPLANGATSVMYEGSPTTRTWTGSGPSSPSTPFRSCTPRQRPSGRSCVGAKNTPGGTTCHRCGCSGRWASRSIPRRGCGTGSTSAAAAARWSILGGRLKRARYSLPRFPA